MCPIHLLLLSFCSLSFFSFCPSSFYFFLGGKTDDAKTAVHAANAVKGLDVMDAHLAKNQYLAGSEFSLADIFFMPYFAMAFYTPEKNLLESRPNIMAWWARVTARPTWARVQALNEFNQKA